MGISQAFADLNSRFVDMVNGHDAHGWAKVRRALRPLPIRPADR